MKEPPHLPSPPLNKKIIFCGPAAAGKTTLKQIFFEKANPMRLLASTLEPTKGFERSIYHQFQNEIAIFDLGGQENPRWFGKDQEIFHGADIILCVYPVTSPLNEVISFIYSLARTINQQCPNANFIFLYHKRDLVPVAELVQRIKQLRNYFRLKSPEILKQITIYVTSIAESHFFSTYRIFGDILRKFLLLDVVPIKSITYQEAELGIRILLEFQHDVKYHIGVLPSRYHISPDIALHTLEKLKELYFVEFYDTPGTKIMDSFKLTDQASFFVAKIKKNLIYPRRFTSDVRSSKKIIEFFSQIKKTQL